MTGQRCRTDDTGLQQVCSSRVWSSIPIQVAADMAYWVRGSPRVLQEMQCKHISYDTKQDRGFT